MSDSMLLAILSIGEIAIVASGLAVFLLIRYKKLKKTNRDLVDAVQNTTTQEPAASPSLHDLLDQQIELTNAKIQDLPEEQAALLELRKAYLESEKTALSEDASSDAYWEKICQRISDISSTQNLAAEDSSVVEENNDIEELPVLNELDDIDIAEPHDDIPILEDAIGQPIEGVDKAPQVPAETNNEDIERLRNIISRQHQSMDELKAALTDKDVDLEQNQELAKKLEEVEVAQAQLNMCIETLEKENGRLNEMLTGQDNPVGAEELTEAKAQLEEANERISNLERENSLQVQRIDELEKEIAGLEQQLEAKNKELERIQAAESDLSQTDDDDSTESGDPDTLFKEIEDLTDLITRKSEELSQLQNDQSDDFSDLTDDAELPEMILDDDLDQAPADKAVG